MSMDINEICPPLVSEFIAKLRADIAEEEATLMQKLALYRSDDYSTAEQIERRIERAHSWEAQGLREKFERILAPAIDAKAPYAKLMIGELVKAALGQSTVLDAVPHELQDG